MTIEAQLLLDYEKVKSQLMTYAMSYLGRSRIVELKASVNQRQIEGLLWETEEALRVVVSGSSVLIPSLDGVESSLSHLEKGFVLSEQEIGSLVQFMLSTQQLKRYMEKKGEIAPRVAAYALSLDGLDELVTELLRSVEHGQVTDEASDALARIRKKIRVQADQLDRKLQSVLQKYSKFLQDHIVTTRNGRHVLSVKREHKRAIKGIIVDESASGQTVFMEPNDLLALQDEMNELKILEELERARVLGVLTGMIDARLSSIKQNLEITGHYDFLFAKAKYAKALGARSVKVNGSGRIDIRGSRHPLLEGQCIPLDFRIGQTYRALVITGPNTGGKTVTLKTVGLLTLMVQSGLLVPVEEGSEFAVFSEVLVDIGDGQSLEQSLSTFSAHVRNIIDILNRAGKNTLILLDNWHLVPIPARGSDCPLPCSRNCIGEAQRSLQRHITAKSNRSQK
nr:hypothetical protein [Alicyclobacillus dauci]